MLQGAMMPSGPMVNQFGLVMVTSAGGLEHAIRHVGGPLPYQCYP